MWMKHERSWVGHGACSSGRRGKEGFSEELWAMLVTDGSKGVAHRAGAAMVHVDF